MPVSSRKTLAAIVTTPLTARPLRHLFVSNVTTGKRFLVDSGAEISVMPPIGNLRRASDIVLTGANGTKIATYYLCIGLYGSKTIQLELGFHQKFIWCFEIAGVAKPIIDSNFLYYFGLLIDIRQNSLINCINLKSVKAFSVNKVPVYTIFSISLSSKWTPCCGTSPESHVNHPFYRNFCIMSSTNCKPPDHLFSPNRAGYCQINAKLRAASLIICATKVIAAHGPAHYYWSPRKMALIDRVVITVD